jgi:hypothetical protein
MDEFEKRALLEVMKLLLEGMVPIERAELLSEIGYEFDGILGVQVQNACGVRLLQRLHPDLTPAEFYRRLWERDRLTINAELRPTQDLIPGPYRTVQHQDSIPTWDDWLAEATAGGNA